MKVEPLLARKRSFKIPNFGELHTPRVVPSFSSKGFSELKKYVEHAKPIISNEILVSAFDLELKAITAKDASYAEFIILDSGGYETSTYSELSEIYNYEYVKTEWTRKKHQKALENWASDPKTKPTIAVSYDHEKDRNSLEKQIKEAKLLFKKFPQFGSNFLVKPETPKQKYIQIDNLIRLVHDLASFDIIGLTEKELGDSFKARILNIAKLRQAFDKAGLKKPIHIFGSLDPISTPLYFMAGADIFDGLTWLRFAYIDGMAVYQHNGLALGNGGLSVKYTEMGKTLMQSNWLFLSELQMNMERFLHTGNVAEFKSHLTLFEDANTLLKGAMEA
jgi:hypothetical protein